jgi:restriction endonuclease S subunit
MKPISDFFYINYGQKKYHNKENLDSGNTVLISSQAEDNGCYGFFDIKPQFKPPFITVPSTGSIGFAFVQLHPCCVCDDALVLAPKFPMPKEYLFYVAYAIQRMKWRFNYGRKITPRRLGKLRVKPPEETKLRINFDDIFATIYPQKTFKTKPVTKKMGMREIPIIELFDLERGQFHAIDRLEKGEYPTVSRVSTDNGIVGFFKKPKKAKVYPPLVLTISTVTGDAFLQINRFIATDNVLVCIPKQPFSMHVLLYIQAVLNSQKWRYSYGRQPYKRIFQKASVSLPVKKDGTIDYEYMRGIVEAQSYFQALFRNFQQTNPDETSTRKTVLNYFKTN